MVHTEHSRIRKQCVVTRPSGKQYDTGWSVILAIRSIGCVRSIASVQRMVSAAWFPGLPWPPTVAVHISRRRLTIVLSHEPSVRARLSQPNSNVAALFPNKSVIFADFTKLFANVADIFANIAELFSHVSRVLTNIAILFADVPQLLSYVTELLSYKPRVFTDIA